MSFFSAIKKVFSSSENQLIQQLTAEQKRIYQFFYEENSPTAASFIQDAVINNKIEVLNSLNETAIEIISEMFAVMGEQSSSEQKKLKEQTKKQLLQPSTSTLPNLFFPIYKTLLKLPHGCAFQRAAMVYLAAHKLNQEATFQHGQAALLSDIIDSKILTEEQLEERLKAFIQLAITVPLNKNEHPLRDALVNFNAPDSLLNSIGVKFFSIYYKESHRDIEMLRDMPPDGVFGLKEAVVVLSMTLHEVNKQIVNPDDWALSLLTQIDYDPTQPNKVKNFLTRAGVDYTKPGNFNNIIQFQERYQKLFL